MLRLKSQKQYRRLSQSTQKTKGRYFIVVYIFDTFVMEHLAGITVSRKVGNAVARNRVKRRIRAFLQEYVTPETRSGVLCNIIALPSVVDTEWNQFKDDLKNCIDSVFHREIRNGLLLKRR